MSHAIGKLTQSKSEVKMCPSPINLILRPAEVGLLSPFSGPTRPSAHILVTPTSATLEVVT